MALPERLEKLINKSTPQTEIEAYLAPMMIKRLENSLRSLTKLVGSEASESYEKAVRCAIKEMRSECLDRFEEKVETLLLENLRRELTEGEEALISVLVDDVVSITEAILILGGIEFVEEEDEEEDDQEDN